MSKNNDHIYYQIGKFIIALVFAYKAIEFFTHIPAMYNEVPWYFFTPVFWIVILGVIWAAAAISFFFNIARRLMAIIVATSIIVILVTSTWRGFENPHSIVETILKFGSWFSLMGGALMLGSYGEERYYTPDTHEEIFPKNPHMFTFGRFFVGIFFVLAGILHLTNINADAKYVLHDMPGAVPLVIFTGICWIACGIALWFNIVNKLAALGAIILLLIITFMVNLRGFDSMSAWKDITQVFTNLSLIGGCLVLASRGHWWFTKPEHNAKK